ncbi:hypothetical protein MZA24_05865, partial [Haemophilus influenzae]
FNYSPIHRATTNTRLVSFETATPFVPYISALKDGVLLHRADKIAKPLIKKLLDKLQSDNPEKWRHLTRYLNNEIC